MENIMLNESKTFVKIVDFGLSNSFQPGQLLNTHCGSPEYAAPELFIANKMYGPGVDIWSIGVIFYGMVTGRLPFLTPTDTTTTVSDKKKNLLTQINKGFSATHRKALQHISVEFRALLARLLMPNPTNRITMNQLVEHPWITEHNKRNLKVTGYLQLNNAAKNEIIKEVALITQNRTDFVECAVKADPYGSIGGLYNILKARRYLLKNAGMDVFPKTEGSALKKIPCYGSTIKSATTTLNTSNNIESHSKQESTKKKCLASVEKSAKTKDGQISSSMKKSLSTTIPKNPQPPVNIFTTKTAKLNYKDKTNRTQSAPSQKPPAKPILPTSKKMSLNLIKNHADQIEKSKKQEKLDQKPLKKTTNKLQEATKIKPKEKLVPKQRSSKIPIAKNDLKFLRKPQLKKNLIVEKPSEKLNLEKNVQSDVSQKQQLTPILNTENIKIKTDTKEKQVSLKKTSPKIPESGSAKVIGKLAVDLFSVKNRKLIEKLGIMSRKPLLKKPTATTKFSMSPANAHSKLKQKPSLYVNTKLDYSLSNTRETSEKKKSLKVDRTVKKSFDTKVDPKNMEKSISSSLRKAALKKS